MMPTQLTPAAQPLTPVIWPEIEFGAHDRILILAPHPDDESLACGGVIQRALSRGLPVHVLFLTLGDNNEWSFMVYRKRPQLSPSQGRAMGEVRRDEGMAAAWVLGLPPEALTFLGYPDFGTLKIWCSHWGASPPLRSMLTRVTAVPYASAHRPGAAYKGEEILRDLTAVFADFRPTRIFVSHPADYNPDHAALYLFTQIALWGQDEAYQPQVHPFLVHYPRWPRQRGRALDGALALPEQLSQRCAWHVLQLAKDEVSRKEAALQAHQTQYGYARTYLDSFVRTNELYGDFPAMRLPRTGPAALSLGPDATTPATEPAEELEEDERARFVGVDSYTVRLVGDDLELSMGLSRPLAPGVMAGLYCFGYRSDRPFAGMPKLHIAVGEIGQRIADQERSLPGDVVEVQHTARKIMVRIPLAALAQPQRVFINVSTRLGDIPFSSQPWRILELPGGAGVEAERPQREE
jgi:LmbE family N-acetylglucosaminyl deacetylase